MAPRTFSTPSHAALMATAAQTYWAASGRVWTLERLIEKASDSHQREALRRLRKSEKYRMETAREVMEEIGGLDRLRRPDPSLDDPEPIPWPLRLRGKMTDIDAGAASRRISA
jgi:hypothetical protein